MNFLIFAHLSSSSALLPLAIGLLRWRQVEETLKWVIWIALVSVLADAISLILLEYRINTWPVNNLFFVFQFTLFFFVLSHGSKYIFMRFLFYGCLVFAMLNYGFLQTPMKFNSYSAYVGGIIIIVTALIYLYQLLEERPTESVQKLPLFWIAFGVLIYYGGTMFLFLFNNYLVAHQPEEHQMIWILHNSLNITKNAFLFTALWMSYKGKISPQ